MNTVLTSLQADPSWAEKSDARLQWHAWGGVDRCFHPDQRTTYPRVFRKETLVAGARQWPILQRGLEHLRRALWIPCTMIILPCCH